MRRISGLTRLIGLALVTTALVTTLSAQAGANTASNGNTGEEAIEEAFGHDPRGSQFRNECDFITIATGANGTVECTDPTLEELEADQFAIVEPDALWRDEDGKWRLWLGTPAHSFNDNYDDRILVERRGQRTWHVWMFEPKSSFQKGEMPFVLPEYVDAFESDSIRVRGKHVHVVSSG